MVVGRDLIADRRRIIRIVGHGAHFNASLAFYRLIPGVLREPIAHLVVFIDELNPIWEVVLIEGVFFPTLDFEVRGQILLNDRFLDQVISSIHNVVHECGCIDSSSNENLPSHHTLLLRVSDVTEAVVIC